MKITNPEMKVVRFASDDVIATSLYIMSKADLYQSNEYEGYVLVRGTMGGYDENEKAWGVGGYFDYDVLKEGSIEQIRDSYGDDIYFAYRNEYDSVYTKGATYWEIENQ